MDWKTGLSSTEMSALRSAPTWRLFLKSSVSRTLFCTSLSSSRAARVSLEIGILISVPAAALLSRIKSVLKDVTTLSASGGSLHREVGCCLTAIDDLFLHDPMCPCSRSHSLLCSCFLALQLEWTTLVGRLNRRDGWQVDLPLLSLRPQLLSAEAGNTKAKQQR